jgi:hypothetical protein
MEEDIRSFNRFEVTCRGRNLLKEVIGLLSPSTGRKLPKSNISFLEEVIRSFNRYEVTCRGRNLLKEVIGLLSPSTEKKITEVKISLAEEVKFGPLTGTRSQRSKLKGGLSIFEFFNSYRGQSVL